MNFIIWGLFAIVALICSNIGLTIKGFYVLFVVGNILFFIALDRLDSIDLTKITDHDYLSKVLNSIKEMRKEICFAFCANVIFLFIANMGYMCVFLKRLNIYLSVLGLSYAMVLESLVMFCLSLLWVRKFKEELYKKTK